MESSGISTITATSQPPGPPDYAEISAANIVSTTRTRKPPSIFAYRLAVVSGLTPPTSFEQIRHRADQSDWLDAYYREITNIETIGSFEIVPRPTSSTVVPILELFTSKFDNILKRSIAKCRIVARGDTQPKRWDVYSPVAGVTALRLFCTVTTYFECRMSQMDVSGAFLYGKLKHPIYLELPRGHKMRRGRGMVWKTHTALYGLVEAPAVWNRTLRTSLKTLAALMF